MFADFRRLVVAVSALVSGVLVLLPLLVVVLWYLLKELWQGRSGSCKPLFWVGGGRG